MRSIIFPRIFMSENLESLLRKSPLLRDDKNIDLSLFFFNFVRRINQNS